MKLRLLTLFIMITALSFGQSLRRTTLGLEPGALIPLNDFASADATLISDTSESYPGFAKTGMMIRLVFEHRLTHNFGVQADFIYGYNNIDQEKMAVSLGQVSDAALSIVASRPWNYAGILAGPFFKIPFTDDFSFMIRGKAGGVGVYSPEYKITGHYNDDQSKIEYYQYVNKTFSFIWTAGAGFQYMLSKYSFSLYSDYLALNADFDNVTGQDWSVKPPAETQISFRQKISAVSITFGISYIF